MTDIGRPGEGETVVVSAAADAVGSIAGQIAKLRGARVVAETAAEQPPTAAPLEDPAHPPPSGGIFGRADRR